VESICRGTSRTGVETGYGAGWARAWMGPSVCGPVALELGPVQPLLFLLLFHACALSDLSPQAPVAFSLYPIGVDVNLSWS
jgi:hypothetical protein